MMKYRQIIKFYFTLFLFIVFTPQQKTFASTSLPGCQAEFYKLIPIRGQITTLDALKTSEFIGSNNLVQVEKREDLLAAQLPNLNRNSNPRNIESLWRMRVKNTDLPLIRSSNAKYKFLSNNIPGSPFNQVNIKPLNSIREVLSCAENSTLIEGGATIEFMNLSQVRITNSQKVFQGKIEICVPVNGTTCEGF
ncbi:MAG: hypothetical protein IGS39_13075 [Calothrix sp. C42_A2020_038]|nr:hypothetical protein [Calothrix sp. C42_A2020_038]